MSGKDALPFSSVKVQNRSRSNVDYKKSLDQLLANGSYERRPTLSFTIYQVALRRISLSRLSVSRLPISPLYVLIPSLYPHLSIYYLSLYRLSLCLLFLRVQSCLSLRVSSLSQSTQKEIYQFEANIVQKQGPKNSILYRK